MPISTVTKRKGPKPTIEKESKLTRRSTLTNLTATFMPNSGSKERFLRSQMRKRWWRLSPAHGCSSFSFLWHYPFSFGMASKSSLISSCISVAPPPPAIASICSMVVRPPSQCVTLSQPASNQPRHLSCQTPRMTTSYKSYFQRSRPYYWPAKRRRKKDSDSWSNQYSISLILCGCSTLSSLGKMDLIKFKRVS